MGSVVLFFYGPANADWYGLQYRDITEAELVTPGNAVYAIGAHHMDSAVWTARLKPDHVVGHSIFVYDLRDKAAAA